MNTFKRLQEWWRNLWHVGKSREIECPYCGAVILMPPMPIIDFGSHGNDRIHVAAPGSVIPCPECKRNLSEFLRSGCR